MKFDWRVGWRAQRMHASNHSGKCPGNAHKQGLQRESTVNCGESVRLVWSMGIQIWGVIYIFKKAF